MSQIRRNLVINDLMHVGNLEAGRTTWGVTKPTDTPYFLRPHKRGAGAGRVFGHAVPVVVVVARWPSSKQSKRINATSYELRTYTARTGERAVICSSRRAPVYLRFNRCRYSRQ
jgi:hypothetical protein